jgi:hypothetical protein
MSRMKSLPTGTGELHQFVDEAKDYKARGLLTSGHLTQLDAVARNLKSSFTNSGEYANPNTPLIF